MMAADRDYVSTGADNGKVFSDHQFARRQGDRAAQIGLEVHGAARRRVENRLAQRPVPGVAEVGDRTGQAAALKSFEVQEATGPAHHVVSSQTAPSGAR